MILAALYLVAMLSDGLGKPDPGVIQRYSADGIHDWSTLTLYADNTFRYESRGGSCFAWHDWRGTWSKKGDLLYLAYSITVNESQERVVKASSFPDATRILVVVTSPSGAPLRDIPVTFNGRGYESTTGADGRAFLDYDDIPEFTGSGSCKSKKLEQHIVRDGKRTISFPIDRPLSNYFEVVIDSEPKKHEEARQDVYRMKSDKVVLVDDGIPERAEAVGETRPRVLRAADDAKDAT